MHRSVTGSLTAVVLLCAATFASADGDPQRGEELYLAHGCYACHGYDGIGRRPLANDASPYMADETVFITYLRLGGDSNPSLPSNAMPSYDSAVINDEDGSDLYAYVKTLVDDPPELQDIRVFTQILERAREAGDARSEDDRD